MASPTWNKASKRCNKNTYEEDLKRKYSERGTLFGADTLEVPTVVCAGSLLLKHLMELGHLCCY